MSASPKRIHRAWVIAGVTFLTLIAAAAFRSTTSVLFNPLEQEFGWNRTQTSLALTVNLVFYGLTAPFAAVVMERITIRRTAIFSLILIALGTGLTLTMTQAWQLALYWGVFVGIGTGALALVFASIVANRWFETKRGLVTGIFSAAYATGALVFLPLITHMVMHNGWRIGSVIVTVIVASVIPFYIFVFKEKPADVGLLPYGASEPRIEEQAPRTVKETLSTLREAFTSKAFWVLAGTFFVCGWTTNGLIGAHFIPATHDHGMPETTAASLLAIVGIFDFVGTIASGWLTDKVNPRVLLVFYYGLRGLALFTVPYVLGPTAEPPLWFFIVFYGLDWIATVPPTIALTREYFGNAKSGVVYGWVFASHMIGAAIAAAYAGIIRDVQGDYFIAWMTAAVLCLIAAGSMTLLRKKK
jgi:sugar phosphate permease